MGIDLHAVNLVAYASQRKPLGCVATLGRQGLLVPQLIPEFGPFCEQFLIKRFGASRVDSYDFSGYEGATDIADFNKQLTTTKQYDTVIDCGCSEHIYNISQALKNISVLCANGGQILHVVPANNFCGHGFWQFSPELFFSLYSQKNGYSETEVFLAKVRNRHEWYEVMRPTGGRRATVVSKSPLYVIARTVKTGNFSHEDIQQTDYMYAWNQELTYQGKRRVNTGIKHLLKNNRWAYTIALRARDLILGYILQVGDPVSLSNRNPHLRRHNVSDLLPR